MRASGYEPPAGSGKPLSELEEEREASTPNHTRVGDEVTQASEDSFPASDAPPWTASATRGAPEPDATAQGDEVTEASEQSFPASDAPPWTSSAT